MSYRVCVNRVQIFGNNERCPEWDDFLKSQGIEIDEEGCYDGHLTDFMGALAVMESIALHRWKERKDERERLLERLEHRKGKLKPEEYGKSLAWIRQKCRDPFDLTALPEQMEQHGKDFPDDRFSTSLFDELRLVITQGYAFLPAALYEACRDDLEECAPFAVPGHFRCYRLKPGRTIRVHAG